MPKSPGNVEDINSRRAFPNARLPGLSTNFQAYAEQWSSNGRQIHRVLISSAIALQHVLAAASIS
jgi:hypothetical protein